MTEPLDVGRCISRFIKSHEDETGVKFRRNGLRHYNGSALTVSKAERADSPSSTMGNTDKIHRDFYDHGLHPHEVATQQEIKPLPAPPMPMPEPYGTKRQLRAAQGPRRGARIPREESGPLLEKFKNLYETTCGTDHGWMLRLSDLLGCSDSRIGVWWKTYLGTHPHPNSPNRFYVEKLKRLLADPKDLSDQLDPAPNLRNETRRRIKVLRDCQVSLGGEADFVTWLQNQMSAVDPRLVLDWIEDKRGAGPTQLIQMDAVITCLPKQRGHNPPGAKAA